MNLRPALLVLLLIGATAASPVCARVRNVTDPDAPRSLPEQGPVSVRWDDPEQFSEIRYSHNSFEARRGNWVEELALYLREQAAPRLAPGERLEVNITDIDRAGAYEAWRGVRFQDTRFIRDFYPPRIALSFKLTDAEGNVVAQAERKLTDPAFLMDATVARRTDALRFEKDLIDQWLRREFPRTPR